MRNRILLILILALVSVAAYAQAPSSVSADLKPNSTQVNPSPSPGPTPQSKSELTVVKVGDHGFEVSTTFSNPWIIVGLVVGALVVAIVLLFVAHKLGAGKPIVLGLLPIVAVGSYLIGDWRGRANTVSQIQQYVNTNRLTVTQEQLSQPPANATPTLVAPPVAVNPSRDNAISNAVPTPIYASLAGFILLLIPELILLTFIILWWLRGFRFRYHLRHYYRNHHDLDDMYYELSAFESEIKRLKDKIRSD